MIDRDRLLLAEVLVWEQRYLPLKRLNSNGVILDAGASEGETLVFFAKHGYRNFIAVEPDPIFFEHLTANIKRLGVSVSAKRKMFSLDDLLGADYAKIDVEGGERELLKLKHAPCEMLVEVHGAQLLSEFREKWPHMQIEWRFEQRNPSKSNYGVRIME